MRASNAARGRHVFGLSEINPLHALESIKKPWAHPSFKGSTAKGSEMRCKTSTSPKPCQKMG